MKEIEKVAKPYIDAGLGKSFAYALAKKPENKKSIMALWNSKWWKQYEPDDFLICAVLDGKVSEEEGKWLNSIRSDHEELVIACVKGKSTIDWARALLESGFLGHQQAVKSCLEGAMPDVIADICSNRN